MTEITQDDRIRAAEIANTTPWGAKQFLSGKNDKKPLVIGLAAHRIAERDRGAGNVAVHEALHVSAYYAGMKAGWKFCDANDNEGFQRAMQSTEHIATLRGICKD